MALFDLKSQVSRVLAGALLAFTALTQSAALAQANDGGGCTAALALAPQAVEEWTIEATDEFVVEEFTEQKQSIDLGLALDILVPPGYAEHEADFLARRKKAFDELLPLIDELQAGLLDTESFPLRLARLARKYDRSNELEDEEAAKKQKAAVLVTMMKIFSIPVEHHYMELIATGEHSKELKQKLGRSLARIFKHDPGWRPFLDKAMKKANVNY